MACSCGLATHRRLAQRLGNGHQLLVEFGTMQSRMIRSGTVMATPHLWVAGFSLLWIASGISHCH
jgi:hypothetical protein